MLRSLPLALGALTASALGQTSVSLPASQDNTIYSNQGFLSNGAGSYLHVALNGFGDARRALLEFDLAAALPADATITAVELTLHMSMTNADTAQVVALHRLTADWGEGASNAPGGEGGGTAAQPGDATWTDRFFPGMPWTTDGGDFVGSPSATATVGVLGVYTWGSTPAFVADAQAMLDDPAGNHGWILIGEETFTAAPKRFDSRENPDVGSRPQLAVTYVQPGGCPVSQSAAQIVRLGQPANPAALQPGTIAPILGTTWDPRVDHATFLPTAVLDVLVIGQQPANLPAPFGTLLVDLAAPNSQFFGAASAPFLLPVPANCALVGVARSVQAASLDATGALEVTNALDVVLGDF